MNFDAETVAAWANLPAAELRIHAQRLASARLPVDHPVWRHIRKDPALTAKLRGALSGLLTTIKGTRDEHMQRIWINAARTALSDKTAAATTAKEQAKEPTRDKPQAPAPREERQAVEQQVLKQPPAEQPRRPASTVAPLVFQQPGQSSSNLG